MIQIHNLPDRLAEWLSDMNEFGSCSFCTLFPKTTKDTPLTSPVAVIGLEQVEILESESLEDGTLVSDSRPVKVSVGISIHAPRDESASVCTDLFMHISELLLYAADLNVLSITMRGCEYVRTTDSVRLEGEVLLLERLYRANADSYPPKLG